MILELNHCLEEILHANSGVKIAADLATKYRKNVQYNLEATVGPVATLESGKLEGQYHRGGDN
jgi:DASH complex subunit DAD4